MAIQYDCESGDLSSGENLIARFDAITTTQGIPTVDLQNAEMAVCRNMFSHHQHDHPEHRATFKFSIPPGYVERGGIIYRSVVIT